MLQIIAILALAFSPTNFTPGSIEGVWINQRTKAEFKFSKSGDVYNGLLVDAGSPEDNERIKGKTIYIFKNFKYQSNKYCCGTIFLPRKKITAEGNMKFISTNKLEVNGSYSFYTQKDILIRKDK